MVAEFEADLIRQRTREGMRVAKAKGHLRGEQPKLNPRQEAHLVRLFCSGEYTTSEISDLFGVARSTIYRALERDRHRLPAARLADPELEIRLLGVHRERLVGARTRMINELRWQLHDLWPDWTIPPRALTVPSWQLKVSRRLANAQRGARVQNARDMISRVRELTRSITALTDQLVGLVAQVAPQLLAEPGLGTLLAAKFIGEIAGIRRFRSDAQLARHAGCAPIPVASGRTDRHRLDLGGNRQLNHAFHMLAVTKIRHDPVSRYTSPDNAP